MKFHLVLTLTLVSGAIASTFQPLGAPFKAPVTVASGFSAQVIFSNLTTPRGIAFDSLQNLLVVERGFGITAFSKAGATVAGWERTVVIASPDFTQGIQVDGPRLYVSTASEALVYNYDATTKTVSGTPRVIVDSLPPDGDLTTHTLQLEPNSPVPGSTSLLIASGPLTNIDPTARDPASGRSQVRRFAIPLPSSSTSPAPQTWLSGQLIAYGIRNPAGFAFPPEPIVGPTHPSQSLYVVENGASIDNVTGLTAAFVNDNPADELNLVSLAPSSTNLGQSYGFPDCTTLWNPSADPIGDPQYVGRHRGDQFSLNLEPSRGDAWCEVNTNNQPPVLSFQAHSVPLDIKFYSPQPVLINHAFPSTLYNDAFVSFHGSFDRTPPTGYGVVHVPFPLGSPAITSALGYSFIIQATNLTSCPGNCIRPVGLAFGTDGKLYVSSDSSGEASIQFTAVPVLS